MLTLLHFDARGHRSKAKRQAFRFRNNIGWDSSLVTIIMLYHKLLATVSSRLFIESRGR